MTVIGQAHSLIHRNGAPRVQTDIRIGTRTDKTQTMRQKVEKVQQLLRDEEGGTAKQVDAEGNAGKGDAPEGLGVGGAGAI
jgi:hypothetical protein